MLIGERIRSFRKSNKLKLREVSDRTGLSVSFISDVERGRTKPSVGTCQKFCALYGVSLSQMFSGVEAVAHLTPYAVDLAICAPDLHALLDLQGFRFCGYCGNPLSR